MMAGSAIDRLLVLSASCVLLAALFAGGHDGFRTVVWAQNSTAVASAVDVGLLLDLETSNGKRALTSISMAVDDFYSVHRYYETRVVLHTRDSMKTAVGAAAAAVDLLKNAAVKALIGPMTSTGTAFVILLGDRTRVPVVSFSATSPALAPGNGSFFVRTTSTDSSQVPAIAAVVQHFAWRQAALVYDETEYSTGIFPSLIDAIQNAGAAVASRSVIPSDASDVQIDEQLRRLKAMPTRVFVVHMLPSLGAVLFRRADEMGMMADGYVWIVTDGIANVLDILDPVKVASAMRGVIGVRPWVKRSKAVSNFTVRFRRRFQQDNPDAETVSDPSAIQLWAYDTVWAVAMAAEKLQKLGGLTTGLISPWPRSANASTDLGRLGVRQTGLQLLGAIHDTRFQGLAGKFVLVDGQLQSLAFEIVNVNGEGDRTTIGFWTPENGISKQLGSIDANAKASGLNSIVWPGGRTDGAPPRGWEIPTGKNKLRVGVPMKKGFKQFVNVEKDSRTNRTSVTGYCIEVFDAVLRSLPYPVAFEYIPVKNSFNSYDYLISQVFLKNLDAVVGDTTILANRTQYVDFTMPYTDSGMSMIVAVEEQKSSMWVFLQPLTIDLWLGSMAFFLLTAFMVWVIERQNNDELKQLGTIFYFAFSILVFSHKEKLTSNLTKFAVIICMFVVMILTSSYTASLTSMLTVRQLQPTVTDVNQLLKAGASIGYQEGSYIAGMLKRMGFQENMLRNYSTLDQYAEALSKGSARGGVDAVFDEIPYLKLFLLNNSAKFAMIGPTYKTDGFGFVFPRESPLVLDVSRAIMNITERGEMAAIQNKWLGEGNNHTRDIDASPSLTFSSFGGLFLITGIVSGSALIVFMARFIYKERNGLKEAARRQRSLLTKILAMLKHYHNVDASSASSLTFKREGNEEQIRSEAAGSDLPELVGPQSPESASNHSAFSSGSAEERASPTPDPNSPDN